MTDIAEITQRDREKIKEYVESSKFLTYTMLAERFGISKSYLSLILNGKKDFCRSKQNYRFDYHYVRIVEGGKVVGR